MAEVTVAITTSGPFEAWAVYDENGDDTVVTGFRLVNTSDQQVVFDAKPFPATDESPTRFQVTIAAGEQELLDPPPGGAVIAWNEGEPHVDGAHAVFLTPDFPDGELTFKPLG
jgi:hypothetical protein